jgi:hypothetical protein
VLRTAKLRQGWHLISATSPDQDQSGNGIWVVMWPSGQEVPAEARPGTQQCARHVMSVALLCRRAKEGAPWLAALDAWCYPTAGAQAGVSILSAASN